MSTPKLSNRNTAKLKFLGTYILSVGLIFIMLSSFLKIGSSGSEAFALPAATPKTDSRAVIDELLHMRMERLENASTVFAEKNASKEAAVAFQAEETSFRNLVDSLRKSTASLNDAAEKKQMNALLDAFSRIAAKHVHLVKTHAVGNQGDPGAAAKQASAELEELKEILVQKEQKIQELQSGGDKAAALQEKDNIIATLQNRLQQASASQPRTDAGAAEWKDKYEKMRIANERLKETNDKYASQANELKSAYKEVVDDNRRLINQLQSARGGKN